MERKRAGGESVYAGQDLRTRDFSRANLNGVDFSGADLRGANFFEASIEGAEFTGANLADANLEGCQASRACFGNANLVGARLFDADLRGATLSGADLTGADARAANLANCRMVRCILDHANLETADLTGASARGTSCKGTSFERSQLAGACLRELRCGNAASWIEAKIEGVDFTGAYLLRRQILDQNYLHEFRNRSRTHRAIYTVWWLTSDCGRSLFRWGACVAVVTALFGLAYLGVDVDYGSSQTWLSPFYFSMVTLTTLGYGDVLPTSAVAQALVMVEVAVGYMMLGGMLSIFSDKMARRAG